jgi:NADH-quinone oxidoreductase subunit N
LFLGALGVENADVAWLYRILAVVGALNAAVAAWYYLRVLAVMYLRNSLTPPEPAASWPGLATLWACAAITLAGGVYPEMILWATRLAAP